MDDKQAAVWRDLLGRIAVAHHRGATALSQAALAVLREQAGDEEPVRSWVDQIAEQLGCEDGLQELAAHEGFVTALFEQSRQVLAAGDAQLSQVGFAAAARLTAADPQAQAMRGWMILGQVASLLALQATDAARDLALGSLGIADRSDDTSSEEQDIEDDFNQAVRLHEAGQYAEAEALWDRLQTLFDALPDSDAVRSDRAGVRVNRAINLQELGAHEAAKTLYEEAQDLYDHLPESDAVRRHRARVRTNRANNLQLVGAHEVAETLYEQAQDLFDHLPDSDAVRRSRAGVRMNRASNLMSLGAHEAAEKLYGGAQALYDALPDSDAVRSDRATVLMNRANNLQRLGAHEAAETLFEKAQDVFDHLPDSDAVRRNRAGVRMNRAGNLQLVGAHEAADTLFEKAQDLVDHLPDSDAVRADRARVRMNRAGNLQLVGAHEAADTLSEQAQDVFDHLPDSDAVRRNRAGVRTIRANNLRDLGDHEAAETLYEKAQDLYDALPDSDAVRSDRALVRMNRANNLQLVGAHEAADTLYEQAQDVFDHLPDSDAVRRNRAGVRMNRANNPQDLGDHEAAETLYEKAQDLYDALPDSDAVRSDRALVRMNRANNLQLVGAHEAADTLYEQAQDLFDGLPDSDAVRVRRIQVRVNRLPAICALGRFKQARDLCTETVGRSLELVTHESPDVLGVWMQLAREVPLLSPVRPPDEVATKLTSLCLAAVDWLDLMGQSLGDDTVPGADKVAVTIHTALSWLVGHRRAQQAASLLHEYHGRYASAQRLQLALQGLQQSEPGADADAATRTAWQANQLRVRLRDLSGRIQALDTRLGELRDADRETSDLGQQLQQQRSDLQQQRLDTRDELLALLRESRAAMERSLGTGSGVSEQRVQSVLGQGERALVVLLQVRDADEREQAVALVFVGAHGKPALHVVALPAQVLQALAVRGKADGGATRGVGSTRGAEVVPEGRALREAVLASWSLIEPHLAGVREVHVGVHHRLGQLPWQGVDDEADRPRTLSVHHGIALALRALERGAVAAVAPPQAGRRLGVLAHTPEQPIVLSADPEVTLGPIPGVHADLSATQAVVGEHHERLQGRQALLQAVSGLSLVQLSCHGQPGAVHTGLDEQHTGAYELVAQLERAGAWLQACILVACSSAQANENAWGEAGGLAAVMHDRCELVLGALHPVDDLFCTLLVLLLHREWRASGDLKGALRQVRCRLRSGQWADDEAALTEVQQQWEQALWAIPGQDGQIEQAREMFEYRDLLYADRQALQNLVEGFVAFG